MLQSIDLNLLPVLERLVATRSVTQTAAALRLSVPAASRALGRIRLTLGDPILVRAGRRFVLTPRAQALEVELTACLQQVGQVLSPASVVDLRNVRRSLQIKCEDLLAGMLAAPLYLKQQNEAPGLELRFLSEQAYDHAAVRNETIDLEISGSRKLPAETIVRPLYTERLVALVRPDHPVRKGKVTARRYVAFPHVLSAGQSDFVEETTRALRKLSLKRTIGLIVPSFYAAGIAVRASDLIASMPEIMAQQLKRTMGLEILPIPLTLPPIAARLAWHPRYEHDSAHRWLRESLWVTISAIRTDLLSTDT